MRKPMNVYWPDQEHVYRERKGNYTECRAEISIGGEKFVIRGVHHNPSNIKNRYMEYEGQIMEVPKSGNIREACKVLVGWTAATREDLAARMRRHIIDMGKEVERAASRRESDLRNSELA